jgi:hypothetical protein
MRSRFLIVAALLLLGGCGSSQSGSAEKSSEPKAQPSAAELERQVAATLTGVIDDDDCAALSDSLVAEWYPDAADPHAACERDTEKGLRRGDYSVKDVEVRGTKATATIALKAEGGERIYTMQRDGARWLVDGSEERKVGKVGDHFTFIDAYELNGEAVDVRLRATLLSVAARPKAPQFLAPENGKRWVRARIRLRHQGDDDISLSDQDLVLIDAEGQRYLSDSYAWKPSLGEGLTSFSPGDTITGYISYQVPRNAKLRELRLKSPISGTGATPIRWQLTDR